MSSDRQNKDYIILAQLYAVINNDLPDKHKAISKILQGKVNINYQIPGNQFFTLTQPKLIGFTALHMALERLDLEVFRQLLQSNADFIIQDNEGHTVLHRAIERSYLNHKKCWELKGKLEHPFASLVLTAHVQQRNFTNTWNRYGISNLHIACMMNHVEAVKFFIESEIPTNLDINASSPIFPGYTALHFAARYSSLESAEILTNLGTDLFQTDAKGYTPLHILIERTLEILDCIHVQKENLCEKFMDELDSNCKIIRIIFNQMNVDADRIGLTHLHIACILHNELMAKEIISLVSVDNFVYKDSPIWAGYTSLHFAACVSMDMVQLLLRHGANIVAKDVNGVTPLDLCLERFTVKDIHYIILSNPLWNSIKFSDNFTKLSDFILALQDPNVLVTLFNTVDSSETVPLSSPLWPGHSILHLAVLFCDRVNKISNIYETTDYFKPNIEECDYLLKLFKNDCKEEEEKMYFQRVKQIMNINPDLVNFEDACGSTPLHLAFRLQNRAVIKLMFEFHEKINNIVDKDGLSHLHIACAMGHERLVEKLLTEKQIANVNCPMPCDLDFLVTDEYDTRPSVFFSTPGWTPLHLAVVTDRADIVQILSKHGANINICDADDFTALHRIFQLDDYNDIGKDLLSAKVLRKNCVTSFGLSYLHVACLKGSEKAVKRLLDLGADIEATYFLPEYPDVYSDQGNLTERSFLKKFAGYTPLHIATIEGHLSVIYLLIERGANIFAKSPDGSVLLSDLIFSENSNLSEEFWSEYVEQDEKFQKKLEDSIGLTKLHRMCFYPDEHEIMSFLIYNDVDVNAHIKLDSPIWPQKTPLHFLVMHMMLQLRNDSSDSFDNDFVSFSSLDCPPREDPAGFLKRYIACGDLRYNYSDLSEQLCMNAVLTQGADVTLGDINQLTPVHLASELLFWDDEKDSERDMNGGSYRVKKDKKTYRFPYCLIADQKDFSINPFDIRGMSHFHVACVCDYVESVKQFLEHGVDVNRPLEYFCKRYAGFTPLHLAAYHKSRVTVKILLEYGANVNAENSLGNTPLHVAADCCHRYSNRLVDEEIFEMLINSGARVDSQNLWGETPLAIFMRSGIMTSRGLKIFVRNSHCCVNVFDIKTGKGLLAETLPRHSIRTIRNSYLCKAVDEDPVKNHTDGRGRTVIHNIVSTPESNFTTDLYIMIIERFIKTGVDIDHQDERGWTALHAAAHFGNYNGIVGLLENGADINLSDVNNKSAIELYIERSEENNVNEGIVTIFLLQVRKFYIADLEVSSGNKQIVAQLMKNFIPYKIVPDACKNELDLLKTEKIGSTSVTWFDVLSHTKAFCGMLRDPTSEFVNSFTRNLRTLRERFPEFAGLLLMQYRKAVDRNQLIEPAKNVFRNVCGVNFPELCSHYIVDFLSNNDLKHLISVFEEM